MAKSRKALSKRTRFEVFKRDKFSCQYCGGTPPGVVLVVDHILAVSLGGGNEIHNLATACSDCNAGKSNVPLTSCPRTLDQIEEEHRERAEQVKRYNQFMLNERRRRLAGVVRVSTYWCDSLIDCNSADRGKWRVSSSREKSLAYFADNIVEAEMLNFVDLTISRVIGATIHDDENAWKYFCKVCHNKIREQRGEVV